MTSIAVMLFALTAMASEDSSDHHFHQTSDDIVKALTEDANKSEPRSRSLSGNNTRSLKRKKKNVSVLQEDSQSGKYSRTEYTAEKVQGKANLKIRFSLNSAHILPESYNLLDELGEALNDDRLQHKKIIIAGHTDSSGDTHHNQHLSIKRAKSVRHYLQHKFHNHHLKLEIIGFGDTMPLVPNNSMSNRRINRRVEIISE